MLSPLMTHQSLMTEVSLPVGFSVPFHGDKQLRPSSLNEATIRDMLANFKPLGLDNNLGRGWPVASLGWFWVGKVRFGAERHGLPAPDARWKKREDTCGFSSSMCTCLRLSVRLGALSLAKRPIWKRNIGLLNKVSWARSAADLYPHPLKDPKMKPPAMNPVLC